MKASLSATASKLAGKQVSILDVSPGVSDDCGFDEWDLQSATLGHSGTRPDKLFAVPTTVHFLRASVHRPAADCPQIALKTQYETVKNRA